MFFVLAVVSAICSVAVTSMIAAFLGKHGTNLNHMFWRVYAPKNIRQYRMLTVGENGMPGNFFYGFVVYFNFALALILLAIGIAFKALVE